MEYNLVHAMLGRFGILIPLLGLFFEIASIVSQKKLVSKIAGGIVILGSLLVIGATLTGLEEINYLRSMNQNIQPFRIHMVIGGAVAVVFTILSLIRIYLYTKVNERVVIVYMVIYTLTVMANLFSNEIVIHSLRGE
ncbi:DUF2231 domain-containing protein [Persephonella sp.]|uniref:DUF2231 domain-containing protein n=1 Tax=Persephonella sp. TaxID=2060922 RepID=UPI0025D1E5FE|nr:DUF2231 domain-containing protein [Persephonella sp.]